MEKFLAWIQPVAADLKPAHPIVIPPDAIAPGVPTHPIYLPPYIDNTLPPVEGGPGSGDRPPYVDNTLPGFLPYPDQGLPTPPVDIPKPPIMLPPTVPEGSILLVPLPEGDPPMEPPEGSAPGTYPCLAVKAGYIPRVVWVAPLAQHKPAPKPPAQAPKGK